MVTVAVAAVAAVVATAAEVAAVTMMVVVAVGCDGDGCAHHTADGCGERQVIHGSDVAVSECFLCCANCFVLYRVHICILRFDVALQNSSRVTHK